MKKYSYCLLLFAAVSVICLAVGYAAVRKDWEQKESVPLTTMETEQATEPNLAEESEETAEAANQELDNRYFLVVEDGFLLVFPRDGNQVCMYTHVPVTDFPEEEQEKLRAGIWFSSMLDIFNYLESYTS